MTQQNNIQQNTNVDFEERKKGCAIRFSKNKIALYNFFDGMAQSNPEYYKVMRAMNFAEKAHAGYRKDKVTPEFHHQVEICLYLRTISSNFMNPIEVFILALLHDTYEDYPHLISELESEFPDYFEKLLKLSKKEWYVDTNGELKSNDKEYTEYFNVLQNDSSCSIVKGVDRIHNCSTMIGVFNNEKQLKYVEEIMTYFLPMLKAARKNFPEQLNAYENIKALLGIQRNTIYSLLHKE